MIVKLKTSVHIDTYVKIVNDGILGFWSNLLCGSCPYL